MPDWDRNQQDITLPNGEYVVLPVAANEIGETSGRAFDAFRTRFVVVEGSFIGAMFDITLRVTGRGIERWNLIGDTPNTPMGIVGYVCRAIIVRDNNEKYRLIERLLPLRIPNTIIVAGRTYLLQQ